MSNNTDALAKRENDFWKKYLDKFNKKMIVSYKDFCIVSGIDCFGSSCYTVYKNNKQVSDALDCICECIEFIDNY